MMQAGVDRKAAERALLISRQNVSQAIEIAIADRVGDKRSFS
jgi:hypothetical protein